MDSYSRDQGRSGGFGSSRAENQNWRTGDQESNFSSNSSYSQNSTVVFIDQRDVGRIIGKAGSKIRDLQEQSGANIKVFSRDVQPGDQVRVEIKGDEQAQIYAKELIEGVTSGDDYGSNGQDGNFRRQDGGGRGGGGGGGSRSCFKCGDEGHMSRECPENSSRGGGGGGGGRSCYKCGEEGHISRDCPSSSYGQGGGGGGGGGGGSRSCYNCGEEGHMSRDCPSGSSRGGGGGGGGYGQRSGYQ